MAPLFPSPFRLEKEPVRDRRKSRGEQRREGIRKVLKRRRPWPGQSPPWLSLVWGLGTRQHQGFSRKQQGGWLLVATVHTLWFPTMCYFFLFVCLFSKIAPNHTEFHVRLAQIKELFSPVAAFSSMVPDLSFHPAFTILPPSFFFLLSFALSSSCI